MKARVLKYVSTILLASMLLTALGGQPAAADPSTAQLKHSLEVSETGVYIIRLGDAPLVAYRGGIAGLRATSPEITGARQLDPSTTDSQAYLNYLSDKQADLLGSLELTLGRPIDVKYQYQHVLNAIAVHLEHTEALQAFNLPGVLMVYPDQKHHADTDVGPILIGAPTIWKGETPNDIGTKGEGMIIGILDSGINHAHPSFADIGEDGYDHTNPWETGTYVGVCASDPAYADFCNDKLIGAYDFADTAGPEDVNGHGSHTASTSGGNYVEVDFDDGAGGTLTLNISGVAPHANLIAYKVLNDEGSGWTSDLAAGADQAVADMVDVINYSIGPNSGTADPWSDLVELAFLDATAAGIFVSVSAGNSGPAPSTLGHSSPWTAVTGGTTHNRVLAHPLDIVTDTDSMIGLSAVEGNGPPLTVDLNAPIIFGGDINPENILGCDPWEGTPFTGAIGMVQRGSCNFSVKVDNLAAAGAIAVLVYNNVSGPPVAMGVLEATTIPSMMVTLEDGLEVVTMISGDSSAEATMYVIRDIVYNDEWTDVMYGASSRGPSPLELLAPDYNAPAVNILAAVAAVESDPLQYGFYMGTSMASPHNAGSAALLMDLYPDWTPIEIKSAMATTAWQEVTDSDGINPADPFDFGSGRINLTAAVYAGLVLDETFANYAAANPVNGGEPNTLNQPSMVEYNCIGSCSWTRAVRSTLETDQDWAITYEAVPGMTLSASPETFTLGAGETQTIEITAVMTASVPETYYFGEVILTPIGNEAVPIAHLPVVVELGLSNLPGQLDILTDDLTGTVTLAGLKSLIDIEDLWVDVSGMVLGTAHDLLLVQDPTNGEVYDDLSQVYWTTIDIPRDTMRLVAEVVASQATDVDLFIGTGDTPSEDTELCASASEVWVEYCNLDQPARGTYWVLVQNWLGTGDAPDAIRAITAVVPFEEIGNLTVTDLDAVAAFELFALDVSWAEPSMVNGDFWYAQFSLGTMRLEAGNLGYVNVDLEFAIPGQYINMLPLIYRN